MSKKIKGITVEIGGDTTKLSKDLSGLNKDLKGTQGELNQVTRLLKLDPKNVTLLAQKQELLTKAISGTEDKLELMRKAAQEAEKDLDGTAGKKEKFRKLQREIAEAEQSLKKLEDAAEDAEKGVNKVADAGENLKNSAGKVSDATKGLSTAAAGMIAAMAATVPATDEYRTKMSVLEAVAAETGAGMDFATEAFNRFYGITKDTGASVEAVTNLMQTGFDTERLQLAVDSLAGAVVRFPDTLKIESLADSLQETIATGQATGQYAELLQRLGVNIDTVNGRLGSCTTYLEKQGHALQFLTDNGLAKSYYAWKDQNEILLENRATELGLQEQTADLAETMIPLITKVTDLTTRFLEWFNALDTGSQKSFIAILMLTAAISPVAGLFEKVGVAIFLVGEIMEKKTIKNFVTLHGKTLLIIAAIAVLIGLIVAVANAWDNMTGLEKTISVLGLLTAALFGAGIAMGFFQSALTMGVAAAAIAAGVTAILIAVGSAEKRAKELGASVNASSSAYSSARDAQASLQASSYGGTYGADYGAPGMGQYGYMGQPNITLELDGSVLARSIAPYSADEMLRSGVSVVGN